MKTRRIDALMCALLLFIASTMSPYPAKPGSSFTLKLIWRRLLRIRRSWAIQVRAGLALIGTIGCLLAGTGSIFAQGNLTPPGAPGPTMKSLDQIASHGIAINATNTPGDSSAVFVVSQPGNYYMVGNLTIPSGKDGIRITGSGVTIDMNGFQISGEVSGRSGIYIPASECVVKNGSIASAGGDGIFCTGASCLFSALTISNAYDGIYINSSGAVVTGCTVTGSAHFGLFTGNGAVATNCTAENSSSEGIVSGAYCTISNCVADSNSNQGVGFDIQGFSTVTNCTAKGNNYGMIVTSNCSIIGCTAVANLNGFSCQGSNSSVLNCNASSNRNFGFDVANSSTLINCTASGNGYGIIAASSCLITNCNASNNGPASDSNGIAAGSDSTIKNCSAISNSGNGIQVSQRSQVSDCTADKNGTGATGSGIAADMRSVVRHCNASDNQKSGIVVVGPSLVSENNVDHNGVGGAAAGIDSSVGGGSRIEGNHARDNNGSGIVTNAAGIDVVIRNSAGGSTTIYNPSAGPNFGQLQPPNSATNPMANISF